MMININNLNISFKNENIYNDFSLTLLKGEKLAIAGKSGKGKSTLLNLLAGFITDFKGNIVINDIVLNSDNISEIRKLISWLPQETSLNYNTVNELFFSPFNFALNKSKKPTEKEITEIFNVFELEPDLLKKSVKNISGGQKQRILLASCLLLRKPLLLIDEPTSALDGIIKKKVADYILSKKNITVISATHDSYWIEKSDKVINLV